MSYTVRDVGNVLELLTTGQCEVVVKFAKPGHSMQPGGGIFFYMPVHVDLATAKEHFERHLARNPARNVSTVGERIQQ